MRRRGAGQRLVDATWGHTGYANEPQQRWRGNDMRAALFHKYGGPDVLHIEDAPGPHAGPRRSAHCGARSRGQPIDWKIHAGFMADHAGPAWPKGGGRGRCRRGRRGGRRISGTRVGNLIFGVGRATASEFAVLTSWAPVPPTWALEERCRVACPGQDSGTSARPARYRGRRHDRCQRRIRRGWGPR